MRPHLLAPAPVLAASRCSRQAGAQVLAAAPTSHARERAREKGSGREGLRAHRDPLTLVRPQLEAEERVEHHVHLALAAQRHAARHPWATPAWGTRVGNTCGGDGTRGAGRGAEARGAGPGGEGAGGGGWGGLGRGTGQGSRCALGLDVLGAGRRRRRVEHESVLEVRRVPRQAGLRRSASEALRGGERRTW